MALFERIKNRPVSPMIVALYRDVENIMELTGLTHTQIGWLVFKDTSWVHRLRRGAGMSVHNYEKMKNWIEEQKALIAASTTERENGD